MFANIHVMEALAGLGLPEGWEARLGLESLQDVLELQVQDLEETGMTRLQVRRVLAIANKSGAIQERLQLHGETPVAKPGHPVQDSLSADETQL
mmetsp:Transcript_57757/g.102502  ORF Transcript_57757/g.102502 Transcript_57757/m.102502 type:complete len:94 (-) Transcript_57757:90-371(-)|eukprot:CAMPEP_0197635466 /NCGR_PEP_ID=MMETSP1338-20131121/11280_1 /TAXON_ID=43686 ORGANISM="Pelagodinium beii, Strain RCC1491" /NCGR_SAMPLE_ID=MMETSP1338 /ASSEMBLY_ACC=CAM_ASM_000754 /LENGTH=93 /DNA_ID=CAMNT_0043207523 /DNA_START=21 /DNA_END=302 /DNA_ORIENTATION=+